MNETTEAPAAPRFTVTEDQLLHLTMDAAEKVVEIRESEEIEKDMSLRLRVVGGGCAGFSYDLYFDNKSELDREYKLAGCDVIVDEMSLMYLVGTTIDFVESLAGAGFKFDNPGVKSTCGCGSSFS
ncbi:MAG: iron-sulfur cluster assembly accessory protein [Kofleriaceae bacterium]|nr:iron-sulfur cluster assembly accessory protein [Kofleriaceae bacterium]